MSQPLRKVSGSEEDIEIQLRQKGLQASIATIKKVLSHTEVFVPLSGGRYALRSISVVLISGFCPRQAGSPVAMPIAVWASVWYNIDEKGITRVMTR
jgi:hypothetical protein